MKKKDKEELARKLLKRIYTDEEIENILRYAWGDKKKEVPPLGKESA